MSALGYGYDVHRIYSWLVKQSLWLGGCAQTCWTHTQPCTLHTLLPMCAYTHTHVHTKTRIHRCIYTHSHKHSQTHMYAHPSIHTHTHHAKISCMVRFVPSVCVAWSPALGMNAHQLLEVDTARPCTCTVQNGGLAAL